MAINKIKEKRLIWNSNTQFKRENYVRQLKKGRGTKPTICILFTNENMTNQPALKGNPSPDIRHLEISEEEVKMLLSNINPKMQMTQTISRKEY